MTNGNFLSEISERTTSKSKEFLALAYSEDLKTYADVYNGMVERMPKQKLFIMIMMYEFTVKMDIELDDSVKPFIEKCEALLKD